MKSGRYVRGVIMASSAMFLCVSSVYGMQVLHWSYSELGNEGKTMLIWGQIKMDECERSSTHDPKSCLGVAGSEGDKIGAFTHYLARSGVDLTPFIRDWERDEVIRSKLGLKQ
jgi:hypothetical protein